MKKYPNTASSCRELHFLPVHGATLDKKTAFASIFCRLRLLNVVYANKITILKRSLEGVRIFLAALGCNVLVAVKK